METAITIHNEKSHIANLISTAFEVKVLDIVEINVDGNKAEFICEGWDRYLTMTVSKLSRMAADTERNHIGW